jgi:hypothetical protein
LLIRISPSKIEKSKPSGLRILDRSPEKKVHATQIGEARITASVFVHKRLFVTDREYRRDRPALVKRHSDLQRVPEAIHQIHKPFPRRRWKFVSFSRHGKKFVELIEERRA